MRFLWGKVLIFPRPSRSRWDRRFRSQTARYEPAPHWEPLARRLQSVWAPLPIGLLRGPSPGAATLAAPVSDQELKNEPASYHVDVVKAGLSQTSALAPEFASSAAGGWD